MRPALLQIKQVAADRYDITWKVPRKENMILSLKPVFPDWFRIEQSVNSVAAGEGALFTYSANTTRDIHNMPITIDGIRQTAVDALVYVELLNGEKFSLVAKPAKATVVIPEKETFFDTAKTYLVIGVEHILLGPDHLLFVLALLLIVTGTRKLIYTITAFTLAHSITLSLSVLGYVGLPGPPVEATIALSIMFLAWEMVKLHQGEKTITSQKPWLVSFSFGLLHGLGFAGALQDVGLPQTQIPAALAFFNVGVEVGQLLFIFVMLILIKFIFSKLQPNRIIKNIPAYGIGSVAAFWLIERVVGFWS
jgi:hydrogenase/urease accessory protein HupE